MAYEGAMLEEQALAERLVEQRTVVVADAAPQDQVLRPLDGSRGIDLDSAEVARDLTTLSVDGGKAGAPRSAAATAIRRASAAPTTVRSVAVVALEDDRAVVAAQTDVVAHGVADLHLPGVAVDDVEVDLRVRLAVVRASPARSGDTRDSTVKTPSTAPAAPIRWPVIDLVAADRDVRGVVAEDRPDRLRLAQVAQRRRGAVRVDQVDLVAGTPWRSSAGSIARRTPSPFSTGWMRSHASAAEP